MGAQPNQNFLCVTLHWGWIQTGISILGQFSYKAKIQKTPGWTHLPPTGRLLKCGPGVQKPMGAKPDQNFLRMALHWGWIQTGISTLGQINYKAKIQKTPGWTHLPPTGRLLDFGFVVDLA